MSKPIQVGDMTSLESLDAAYKSSHEHHDRERLLAMRLAHQGNHTLEQIGVILNRGRATIGRWLKAYREGGIQKLLQRSHGGREASLSQSDQEAMIGELYSGRRKRAKDIQIWLQEDRGIDLNTVPLSSLPDLNGIGWLCGRHDHAATAPVSHLLDTLSPNGQW